MFWIKLILCILFIGFFVVVHLLPFLRIYYYEKQLIKWKKLASILSTKSGEDKMESLLEEIVIIVKEDTPNNEYNPILKDTNSLRTYLYDEFKEDISTLQDEVLEIERMSNFEPEAWWPKKYVERFSKVRLELREVAKFFRSL